GQGFANFLSHDASASVAGIPMQGMLSIDNTPRDLLNEQQSTVGTTLGLNQWWAKIEQLDFNTGTWKVVGTSTNAITVSLGDFPGALYRLSSQP
ncbi:hypothetical protein, partial [Burkholderia gladioli]|uniref:hypothetical protein n=1 Tax=Burkholderia gladioli TaxID=28095 RepID=UPI001642044E